MIINNNLECQYANQKKYNFKCSLRGKDFATFRDDGGITRSCRWMMVETSGRVIYCTGDGIQKIEVCSYKVRLMTRTVYLRLYYNLEQLYKFMQFTELIFWFNLIHKVIVGMEGCIRPAQHVSIWIFIILNYNYCNLYILKRSPVPQLNQIKLIN